MISIYLDSFNNVLNEAQQADISILNANKYLTNAKRIESFLYNPCKIEQKVDGIKVQIIRISKTGDNLKDFCLSYKNSIIYPSEFEYTSLAKVKNLSINNSQFKILFEHLKKLDLSQIPLGLQFVTEFACRKPTLSSNYLKQGLVLLTYNKSNYKIQGGKIKFSNTNFDKDPQDLEKYAKIFKIRTPRKLFEGTLALFERGIKDKELRTEFAKIKASLPDIEKSPELYIQKITDLLLSIPSVFLGPEEGCVLKYGDIWLKIQQSYQTDQTARAAIKAKFKAESPEEEQAYWDKVRYLALDLTKGLPKATEKNLASVLEVLGRKLKYLKPNIKHQKKNELQILDDIQTTAKDLIIRNMQGNNGCLFLGKFRILTTAHYGIIKYGLDNFDTTTVCLVSNKETREYDGLRLEMLRLAFGNKIEVIQHSSGHIFSIIGKSQNNINSILCGTDRYADYVSQVSSNKNISVVETPRTAEDISATKIINNIENYAYFCMKTPKEIHRLYPEILKTFKGLKDEI